MCDWAIPGAKVICVNGTHGAFRKPGIKYNPDVNLWPITTGETYTMHSAFINPETRDVNIRLVEARRDVGVTTGKYSHIEAGFHIGRFRPVTIKKSELPASLTSLLSSPKKKIRADIFDKGKIFDPV
jgi:hypothetical protein